MAASALVDLVKIFAASVGDGPFELGTPVPGFRGVAALTAGRQYSYSVQQGSNYEYGTGIYSNVDGTLTRAVAQSSRGAAPVPFTAGAIITFTLLVSDLQQLIAGAAPVPPPPPPLRREFGARYADLQADEVLAGWAILDDMTYAANLTGWLVIVEGVNPTADLVLSVQVNGGEVGTITVAATSGAVSLATAAAAPVIVNAFSTTEIVCPVDADTVAVDTVLFITARGTL